MDYSILNNKIVIIDDRLKSSLIESISDKLINVKIITLNELKRNYYFDYDKETIYYICSKYNVIYDVAKMYLDSMYFIKDINDDKVKQLNKIKNDLEEKKLLYKNELFINFLKDKEVILLDLKHIDKFYLNILNDLNCRIEYLDLYSSQSIKSLYECTDMEEELSLVCSKIIELIKSGVNINNIKLTNVNSNYYFVIKKYFQMFNIPINLDNISSINGTHIVKLFKDNYNNDINKTLETVYENINDSNDMYIYKKLVNIINSYSFINDYNDVKELIFNDISNTKLNSIIYDNAVKIIDFAHEIVSEDDYVFLINYNEGVIPTNHKDEDYLSDKVKELLGVSTSYELNENELLNIRDKISSINNIIVTYSTHDLSSELYLSSSYDETILKKEDFQINYNNSNSFNISKLIKYKDLFNKYGTISKDLNILNSKYKDVLYLSYNNDFKGIKTNNDELTLSYSKIEKYNECAFKYYIDNVLKLNKYEDNYGASLGNITHKVLSECFNDDFDFEKSFDGSFQNCKYEFKDSELYFLSKIKDSLQKSIEVIKNQLNYTSLNETMYEKELLIEINDELNIKLKGYIDKIMYGNVNGRTIVAIIDYKTSAKDEVNLKNCYYGINMQLPLYIHMINKSGIFPNVVIGGFYLQKLYMDDDNLEDSLKLIGYTNADEEVIGYVDNTYENSKLIKGLKVKQDGNLYSSSKVLSNDELEKLDRIVVSKVEECYKNINNACFDINPKVIGNINYGCRYCKYRDICYVKEEDKVYLPQIDKLFGGDE